MKPFSKSWVSSTQPKKQRKYGYNAPLHIKRAFLSVHLEKPLRKKLETRNITIRKGDKVKILRGRYKGKTGSVDLIKTKISKVYVTGIEYSKKDGTTKQFALSPSNLIIFEVNEEDKKRFKRNKNGQKSS